VTPLESDGTLSLLQYGDKQIYLLGTAHISAKSADQVREVIQSVKPDTVFVELCPERAAKMWAKIRENESKSQNSKDLAPITGEEWLEELEYAKQFKAMNQRMLKFLEGFGFVYGGEFHAALEEAERIGASLVYGDRDVRETMKRLNDGWSEVWKNLSTQFSDSWKTTWSESWKNAKEGIKEGQKHIEETYTKSKDGKTESFGKRGDGWNAGNQSSSSWTDWFKVDDSKYAKYENMSTWDAIKEGWEESKKQREKMRAKMPKNNWSEVFGLFTNPEETIEAMKDRKKIKEKFDSMREFAPDLCKGLVDERDEIMANNLKKCKGKVVVAVVGIGHMDGMEAFFKNL